ncbi:hypothetical protein BGZ82_002884 [Podila clonocystis]|nr:hypothetical protein BGZ82_002884 [Podila clonocystis]
MKFSLATIMAVAALMTPALALPAALSASFDNHRVVRINVQNEAHLAALTANEEALGFDYFTHNKVIGGHVDVRIPPASFAKFEALKLDYSTLISNLQTVLTEERQQDLRYQTTWKNRLSEAKKTLSAWLKALIANNPSKVSAISAGKSFQGRDQNGFKIGTGPNHVVFHGTQHAREWITTMVVEYIGNELVTGTDTRVAGYLSKFTFHIIPVMNPDGFVVSQTSNRMHRKNAQTNGGCLGTDTNRNWGFKWGTGGSSSSPCAEDYKGPSAFSSPEATNIAAYLRSLPKVVSYIDFHAYSQLWMVPFGYTGTRPSNYAYLNGLAQKAATALRAVNGVSFRTGDIYNTIYQASGNSADYAYSIGVGAPFAVELRDTGSYGFSLPASQIVPSGKETWAAFAAVLDNITV